MNQQKKLNEMKKYAFILAMLAFSFAGVTQENNIILIPPDLGQAYVVLDPGSNSVTYWELKISSMSYDENFNIDYELRITTS